MRLCATTNRLLPVRNVRIPTSSCLRRVLTSKSDQNPCHCKVIGPTIGFVITVCMAVSRREPTRRGLSIANQCFRLFAGQPLCSAAAVRQMQARSKRGTPIAIPVLTMTGFLLFRWTQAMLSVMPYRYDSRLVRQTRGAFPFFHFRDPGNPV